VCRNPLYFFSFLGGLGVGLANEMLALALVIGIGFAVYYPLVIKAEEKKLREIHAGLFEDYVKRAPRFLPSLKSMQEPDEYVVRPRMFRKGLFDALWFVWLVGILELVEALHEVGALPVVVSLY
jgi:hypothetical protein